MAVQVASVSFDDGVVSLLLLTVLTFSVGVALAKERTRRRAYKRHHRVEPHR